MEKVKNLLSDTALKATPQRLAILKEISKAGHIDLDTIYKNLSKSFPSMSLATVYKNLHTLKENGIIKELNVDNLKNKYELSNQPKHHHLVCKVCGEITDIFLDTAQISQQTQHIEGFDVDYCEVFCYGTCPKCKEKAKGN
jgi:Fur family peroxide stress response transcriptional regulator